MAQELETVGCRVDMWDAAPGRPNVVGLLGSGSPPCLMLNGHLDTVGYAGMEIPPLEPAIREGKMYGRGACDMKGGLVASLAALQYLARRGEELPGTVLLAAVADEEHASLGTESLLRKYRADGAIVTEPTDLRIQVAHKGFAWAKVEVEGRSAHGSRPDEGIDAIVKAGKVLTGMEEMSARFAAETGHPLLGPPSIHASLIRGGKELSTYPDHCRIDLERRTLPGESAGTVEAELRDLLSDIARRDPQFRARSEVFFWRPALETDRGSVIASALASSLQLEIGEEAVYSGAPGWMDSALLSAAGIPTVIFGPGGAGMHAAVEWVWLDQVATAARVLARTAVRFLQGAHRA